LIQNKLILIFNEFYLNYIFGRLNSKRTPTYGYRAISELVKRNQELNNEEEYKYLFYLIICYY